MKRIISLLLGIGITFSSMGEESPVLRILTYNVHHVEGMDGKVDYDRIVKIIRATKADIVALQEIDVQTQRTQRTDQAAVIANKLDMHQVFGKAIDFQGGKYGLAVLSRWPIVSHKVHTLPNQSRKEPRIALETRIQPKNGLPELCVIDTHLCHISESNRSEQVQRLLQIMPPQGSTPVILAGDFNARPKSTPMQWLWKAGWTDLLGEHQGIDYLLVPDMKHWKLQSSEIVNAPVASDHMPVLAELIWTK